MHPLGVFTKKGEIIEQQKNRTVLYSNRRRKAAHQKECRIVRLKAKRIYSREGIGLCTESGAAGCLLSFLREDRCLV